MKDLVSKMLIDPFVKNGEWQGISDSKWMKIAEKIKKVTGSSFEEIADEFDNQIEKYL